MGIPRVDCKRSIVHGERFSVATQRLEHDAEIGTGLGRAWIDAQGFADQAFRFLVPPLLPTDQPEQVQCVEIMPIEVQYGGVMAVGMRELPASMSSHALPQSLDD